MNTSEYTQMAKQEDLYWWHLGRKKIIDQRLKNIRLDKKTKILNIGCGTGGTIATLEKYGQLTNVDTSKEAIRHLKKRGIKNVTQVEGLVLPYKNNSFDIVIALDVLEHIENDSKALKEWYRVLKPEGKLLITVPAYQWLWSEHDESLHHYRRYTASGLHNLVNQNNYKVFKRSYIIVFSFPLIVLYRLIASIGKNPSQKKTSYVMLPSAINTLFVNLLAIEGRLLKYINFPYGTSVLIEAQK